MPVRPCLRIRTCGVVLGSGSVSGQCVLTPVAWCARCCVCRGCAGGAAVFQVRADEHSTAPVPARPDLVPPRVHVLGAYAAAVTVPTPPVTVCARPLTRACVALLSVRARGWVGAGLTRVVGGTGTVCLPRTCVLFHSSPVSVVATSAGPMMLTQLVEQRMCVSIQALPVNPQLHSWWHLLVSLSCHLLFVWVAYLEALIARRGAAGAPGGQAGKGGAVASAEAPATGDPRLGGVSELFMVQVEPLDAANTRKAR